MGIIDTTKWLEHYRRIQNSEAQYRNLIQSINSIIIETNSDGEITFFNRFSEKVFGFSRDELIGKKLVGTILSETDSKGTDNTNLANDIIDDPDRFYFNETEGRRKDGQEVWFSWSARVIDESDEKKVSIMINGNDITRERHSRKQAREAYNILQSSGYAIFRLNTRKKCLFVNRAYSKLVGKRAEDLEGVSLDEMGLTESIRVKLDSALDDAIEIQESHVVETAYQDKFLLFRAEPEYEKGTVSGLIVFVHDITDRRRAEEAACKSEILEQMVAERTELAESRSRQLQDLAIELIEAEERERQRIAELLHEDLQQIMAAAKMHLQVAQNECPSTNRLNTAEGLLDECIDKSRRLSHDLSPPILHCSGLIHAIKWLKSQMKKHYGMHIYLDISQADQFEASTLRVFIFRAVQEILFNVVKHAGVNSAQVSFSGSEDGLIVRIRDYGKGFDPDTLFSRKKPGLGLAVLKERIRAIKGNLSIESVPCNGSQFTLTISQS